MYASSTKTFYVIKRAESSVAWVMLGKFPDMTVEQARTAAQSTLGDFAKGIDPAAAKRAKRQQRTFGEAFEQDYFEKHVIPRAVKRSDDIRAMWERFLGPLPDLPAKKHGRKRTKHRAGHENS